MKKLCNLIIALGVLVALSSCKTAEVYNVPDVALAQIFPHAYSPEQVEKAIITATNKREWSVVSQKSGLIEARYSRGRYSATIDISYTSTHYSINYKESANLEYDGSKINRHYNAWVVKLNKEIQKQLILIANPATGKHETVAKQ